MTYRELLDNATEDLAKKLGIKGSTAEAIDLRGMIRTIYAGASNAQAIADDSDFARDLFIAMCNQGMTHTVNELTRVFEFEAATRLVQGLPSNPFIEVIGDLFND
jgi:hypothetical protein